MNTSLRVSGLGLAIGLCLVAAAARSHAQAPTPKMEAKQPNLPPSVVGGKATTIAVYNFTGKAGKPFWVDPTGTIQPVPDGKPVPPISGTTPFQFPTFVGATLGFQMHPRGGGRWVHLTGAWEKPYIILGSAPDGFTPPEIAINAAAAAKKNPQAKNSPQNDPTGDYDRGAFVPGTRVAPSEKKITNNTTVNNNAPRRRRRPRNSNDSNDVHVVVEPPVPVYFPVVVAGTKPPAATSAEKAPKDDEDDKKNPQPKKRFTAESPVIIEFLKIHNDARAEVGVEPLEWSADLANAAHRWALHIAQTDRLEHRPDGKYGENIAVGNYDEYTPASAAHEWLAEKAHYDHDLAEPPIYRVTKMTKNEEGEVIVSEYDSDRAHYTQMVWGKSTMVGVGTARMKSGELVIVAFYNPRGNIQGEKPY